MLYCDYAILIRHRYRIDTIWHILLPPFRVASLAGAHPNLVFCYDGNLSFFAISSICIKAALGINIRLPMRMLGMVPHFICAYAVPRPIRKSFATSIGVSTSESFLCSWLLICQRTFLMIDCCFTLVFVSPRNKNRYNVIKFNKHTLDGFSSLFFATFEPVPRDNHRSAVADLDQFSH